MRARVYIIALIYYRDWKSSAREIAHVCNIQSSWGLNVYPAPVSQTNANYLSINTERNVSCCCTEQGLVTDVSICMSCVWYIRSVEKLFFFQLAFYRYWKWTHPMGGFFYSHTYVYTYIINLLFWLYVTAPLFKPSSSSMLRGFVIFIKYSWHVDDNQLWINSTAIILSFIQIIISVLFKANLLYSVLSFH